MQKKGYLVIIITNQAGIAKKIFSEEEFINPNEMDVKSISKKKCDN